jgi:hypothetical protein
MPSRKLPPNSTVIAMYESGMSTGQIAEQCGVKPITVVSMLARLGVPRRSAGDADRLARSTGRKQATRFWLGKQQPAEMVEKRISKIRGENHWLWKGGIANRAYRKAISKKVCDHCGATEDLGIHHRNDDHYDNRPENLQVLCNSCHISLHKTAYWEAKRNGEETPKSNGPVGWKRKEV